MADIKSQINPQPLPPVAERVRVFVPRNVAYDLDKMREVTANVLRQAGCGGCHSGRLLEFVTLQDYLVNPQTLEVTQPIGLQQL